MPRTARLLEIADTIADTIGRFLKASLPASRCERVYSISVNDDTFQTWKTSGKSLTVYVLPINESSEIETRRHDKVRYTFGVVFIDRYTDAAGPAPTAWTDKRILQCAETLNTIGEFRVPLEGSHKTDGPRCTRAEFTDLYDIPLLLESDVFWSEAELEFTETVS
jgi:hypothetical protein